jgi:carbonic anhydrase
LLADDRLRHDFAGRGFHEAELARLPVLDPTTTVRTDVATLLDFPNLSARVRVSGYSYDVKAGLLTTTVAPRQRGN